MEEYLPPEKIWEKAKNRYEVILRVARQLRKLLEEEREGRMTLPQLNQTPGASEGSVSRLSNEKALFLSTLKRFLAEKEKDEQ